MTDHPVKPRKPWLAAVLSLVQTGLGQIYCGRIVNGLVLLAIYLLFLPIVFLAARFPSSTAVLAGILLAALAAVAALIYSVVDAYRRARRLGEYRLKDYNHALVYTIFVLLGLVYPAMISEVLRDNALRPFYVAASSMAPSVRQGDIVLANRVAYGAGLPERGDVVVFRAPDDRSMLIFKRVIALPGDAIEIRGGRVVVNDREIERGVDEDGLVIEENAGTSYLVRPCRDPDRSTDCPRRIVPEGHCFVLGDNRDQSRDSRHFGFVPVGDILGPVQYIHYPAGSWSRFGAFGR